jgi:hypothetical protein
MRSVITIGYSSGLRLDSNTLIYCDDRGSRGLDLISGVESARADPCPKKPEERNGACDGIEYVVSVRTQWQEGRPGPGPDDIIDTKAGISIPTNGRVHDCVFNNGVLLYATGLEIIAVDIKTDRHDKKGNDGGNQVAINDAWLAWSDGAKVFADRR